MAIEQVTSNGADYASGISSSQKVIALRKYTSDDPLTWDQNDNNFEILRAALNETIQETNGLSSLSGLVTDLNTQVSALASSQATIISNQQASEALHTTTIVKVAELETEVGDLERVDAGQNQEIGVIKTEHVARTYVRNHVLVKWKTTTTQSQIDEVTTALGLVYDSDVPLTSFKKYLLPLDGRRDAGIVIPILSLHEYVELADFNGTTASY
jgi:hypothetical protein